VAIERAIAPGNPLPKKLGIKEGARVALLGKPPGFELKPLPDGVTLNSRVGRSLDVIVFFTTSRAALAKRFVRLAGALDAAGGLWVAWPKKASGVATDLDQAAVMEIGLASGMVDNKVCAIDGTWSGLRFVVRRDDRPDWPARLSRPG
jgi:hypothetical protein